MDNIGGYYEINSYGNLYRIPIFRGMTAYQLKIRVRHLFDIDLKEQAFTYKSKEIKGVFLFIYYLFFICM
jgi:hypothetical protein